MQMRDWAMAFAYVVVLGALGFIVVSMVRSIQDERSRGKSIFKEFGLSIALLALFLGTWVAHGISEWQVFADEQTQHGDAVAIGDFAVHFMKSTMENWQSEFLQLFAFVTLAALYVHKGSAESKDGTEKIEAALRRIEENLGTLPKDAPKKRGDTWKLPEAPPLAKA